MPIEARFADRVRKRQERRKEAEAAVAKRAAADAELRAKLLAATGGNYTPGPGIDDLAPLKRAPGLVPLDRLLSGIGRASCRGRGEISGGAGSLKKKKNKTAVGHANSTIVTNIVSAWNHNQIAAEIKAIESTIRLEKNNTVYGTCENVPTTGVGFTVGDSYFGNNSCPYTWLFTVFFFFQAEDGIRDDLVTGVQTCALPI